MPVDLPTQRQPLSTDRVVVFYDEGQTELYTLSAEQAAILKRIVAQFEAVKCANKDTIHPQGVEISTH